MNESVNKAAAYWGSAFEKMASNNAPRYWWDIQEIQRANNLLATGDAGVTWVRYAVDKYLNNKAERFLSLGCGTGQLERELALCSKFSRCDAIEVSPSAIEMAKKAAFDGNFLNLYYEVGDVNNLKLEEGIYDAVWVSAAMHHFTALEHICDTIKKALKPGGYLFFCEYVGPNRFQFSKRQKEIINLSHKLIPESYKNTSSSNQTPPQFGGLLYLLRRLVAKLFDGSLFSTVANRLFLRATKSNVFFPTARDVISIDPTEAVRSADILDVVGRNFEIVEKRNLGGNIYQSLLANISENFLIDDEQSRRLIRMIINIEQTMILLGEFQSDRVFVVAKPKNPT